jgi:UDP-3-O-[3-hydroxymyristoyl] glucosamine N-acyltransferase
VIAAGARVADGAYIGPCVYLAPGASVGRGSRLHSNVSVQRDCQVGERCTIHPGTSIGGDGFGYQWDGSSHRKVPQLGRVVIEDDVEIGCNVCVDRATLGVTTVGRGSRIDNLVQVAHNVEVGEHVILVSQCGVAGSTRIGSGTIVAGQAAISDHLTIGPGARVGGQAGVTRDVAGGDAVTGTPARAVRRTRREQAALGRVPEMSRQLDRQRRLIEELQERLARLETTSSG